MSQHYLFILTHPKPANAAYFLALIAAAFLPAGVKQTWLSVEESSEKQLLEHTLLASDVVLVSSLAVQHGYQQYFTIGFHMLKLKKIGELSCLMNIREP